jgi:hypothetical protein
MVRAVIPESVAAFEFLTPYREDAKIFAKNAKGLWRCTEF